MLINYINAAMRRAHYEIPTDEGSCYGDIPNCETSMPMQGGTKAVEKS